MKIADITVFMDSDAYHLTIKTQNTADGENTTKGEKGKKSRPEMLGRTSDCFPICFGQFQPASKNLMDKALKKEKKVKFTLEVGRSTRTLDCFYLSRHGGSIRLGGSVTVRWEGGVRSRPSVRSVSGSLEGRFPSLTL